MDSIFHEKQEGQLCAQHCLNNLLQGEYFTAVDLAKFATELDEAEKIRMAEGGFESTEFLKFMAQPSSNMDDSGYFSVQVISKALSVWSLFMTPLSSPEVKDALDSPTSQKAFICNHQHHWFTVRKLGRQWFNLNSLQRRPELISDTYLKMFLAQLQMEGYSIFVVKGNLPDCEADQLLTLVPVQPQAIPGHAPKVKGQEEEGAEEKDEYALELAMAMSASVFQQSSSQPIGEPVTGAGVLAPSTAGSSSTGKEEAKPLTLEQLREKRLQHFK